MALVIGLKNPGRRTERSSAYIYVCMYFMKIMPRASNCWKNGHANRFLSQVIKDLLIVKHYFL